MKKTSQIILFLLFSAFSNPIFAQADADKILGVWLAESKDGKIEIYKTGSKYYGKLVYVKPNEDGTAPKDTKNPDAKLRSRVLEGTEILKDFVYDEGEWEDGTIYDPQSGKTYSCEMTLGKEAKTLNIRGYVGVSWLGRTSVWTKTEK